jgi:hypothetical protein
VTSNTFMNDTCLSYGVPWPVVRDERELAHSDDASGQIPLMTASWTKGDSHGTHAWLRWGRQT